MVSWHVFVDGREVAVLSWEENRAVWRSGTAAPEISVPYLVYDPRGGSAGRPVLPVGDPYTADLWISAWGQTLSQQGGEVDIVVDGLDWGEQLAPTVEGRLY